MNKKIFAIIGGIVLLLVVAGGSFYGGIVYQRAQAANLQASFFANRGGGTGGGGGGNFPGLNGGGNGGNAANRGAVGQIKSIDGNTITISTPQAEVKVTLTGTTVIDKTVTGTVSDLTVGERIVVRGTRDSAGNITATTVQLGGGAPGQ